MQLVQLSLTCIIITIIYLQVLKRDRFSLLLKFFHLNDGQLYKKKGERGHDLLFKLHPFLTPHQQL